MPTARNADPPGSSLDLARAALADHRWAEAMALFAELDPPALAADDLDRFGEAAWWTGQLNLAIRNRERAYAQHMRAGDELRAAGSALALANDYSHRLESALAAGWLRRAERLLEQLPEAREHGLLERARVSRALAAADLDGALTHADRILALAQRLGDRTLEGLGLQDRGRVLVARGEVEEGLALLDEAMVAAISGELEPYATAVVYCNATVACQDLADYRRAAEWADAAKRWCEQQAISGFPGMCRVRRVEVTRLRGAWAEAEQEATTACEELQEFCLDYAGEGFYQIGEIRLRMGDFGAAERAFRQAHELGRPPLPGLALLRLAEGRVDEASRLLRSSLADSSQTRLFRARLLAADVEVALMARDQRRAAEAASELGEIAELYGTHALRATAAVAAGRVLLADGRQDEALVELRRGWRWWQETEAPYEASQARTHLAEALLQRGDAEAATLELDAAQATFERLGAGPERERVVRLREAARQDRSSPAVERAFMFTDIVDSTRLIEVVGDDAWGRLLAWHDRAMRRLIAEHDGEEVHHAGDGFFVAFPSAAKAVACALAMQQALGEHRVEHGFAPRVRIGLHLDRALRTGQGYEGRGVHLAARIAGLAGGDEIVASAETVEAAGVGVRAAQLRTVTVKGIGEAVTVATVLGAGAAPSAAEGG